MTDAEKLYDAIGKAGDKYVKEAGGRMRRRNGVKYFSAIAAVIAVCIVAVTVFRINTQPAISVYAAGSDVKLVTGRTVEAGRTGKKWYVDAPLQFYVKGNSIDSIRFEDETYRLAYYDRTDAASLDNWFVSNRIVVSYRDTTDSSDKVIAWGNRYSRADNSRYIDAQNESDEKFDRENGIKDDTVRMHIRFRDGSEQDMKIKIHQTDYYNYQLTLEK